MFSPEVDAWIEEINDPVRRWDGQRVPFLLIVLQSHVRQLREDDRDADADTLLHNWHGPCEESATGSNETSPWTAAGFGRNEGCSCPGRLQWSEDGYPEISSVRCAQSTTAALRRIQADRRGNRFRSRRFRAEYHIDAQSTGVLRTQP